MSPAPRKLLSLACGSLLLLAEVFSVQAATKDFLSQTNPSPADTPLLDGGSNAENATPIAVDGNGYFYDTGTTVGKGDDIAADDPSFCELYYWSDIFSMDGPDAWYELVLDDEYTVVTSTRLPGTDYDSSIAYVADDETTILAGNDDAEGQPFRSFLQCTLSAGEYYIVIDGCCEQSGEYEMELYLAECTANVDCDSTAEQEPNDGWSADPPNSSADTIHCGETICGELSTPEFERDEDWFYFAHPGGGLVLDSWVESFDPELALTVIEPEGDILAYADETAFCDDELLVLEDLAPGEYYAVIAHNDVVGVLGDQDYSLTLSCCEPVDCTGGVLAESEPNEGWSDDNQSYEEISCGEVYCGEVWAEGGARDEDWYRFEHSGGPLTVTCEAGLFDPELRVMDFELYGGTHAVADQETYCGTEEIYHADLPAGVYYIFVAHFDYWHILQSDPRSYRLTLECPGVYPDDFVLEGSLGFPAHNDPTDFQPQDYRIFGLPGDPEMDIDVLFQEAQIPDWQAYWDNGADLDYFVEFDGGDRFILEPGRAFWVISADTLQIDMSVHSASLIDGEYVPIDLHEGWNLITNPFGRPLSWTIVKNRNGVSQPIWGYSSDGFSMSEVMSPMAGYYYNNDVSLSQLAVPYSAVQEESAIQSEDPADWRVGITLRSGEIVDRAASFGVSDKACPGPDELDYLRPRGLGSQPKVYFKQEDAAGVVREYATSIRPPDPERDTWTFHVRAAAGAPARLEFTGLEDLPADRALWLLDHQRARARNLRADPVFEFTPPTTLSEFGILAGAGDFSGELAGLLPQDIELGACVPNPFNPRTAIPLSLPRDEDARLEVFNLLGRRVALLHEGRLEAGMHWFHWDGADGRGVPAAGGIYFYRLRTGDGFSRTRKMILAR